MMRKSSAPSQSRNSGNGLFPNSNYVRSIESVLFLLDKDESETFEESTTPPTIERPVNHQKKNTSHENNVVHEQSMSNNALILSQSKKLFGEITYFKIVWGKPSTKKYKTWDGDGFLELSEKTLILRDNGGTVLGTKSLLKPFAVNIGQILSIGSKIVEIIETCSRSECHLDVKKPKENEQPIFSPICNKPLKSKKQESAPIQHNIFCEQSATNNLLQTDNSSQFKVVWGKPSTKKHKTWDGDGFLEVSEKSATLRDDNGTVLGAKILSKPLEIQIGQILTIGSKTVEIIEPYVSVESERTAKRPNEASELVYRPTKLKKNKLTGTVSASFSNICKPLDMRQVQPLTLPPPSSSHQWKHNINKSPICSVVVDSFLTLRLRPHQQDGLVFLYSCVMGYSSEYTGAILADEMGLGKTLQCIALIWTLLKHGPYGVTVIKRALIITPGTLCGTWEKEILKWLGRERLLPFVVDNSHKPRDFKARPNLPVMIVSYERFVKHADEIESMGFDIIICDEAHRLKNANIKAAQALQNLTCKKRVLLTGTPIQNDLQEYFVLIDIANPGILGSYNDFKEEFVNPILISQQPESSEEESIAGEHSAARLQLLTSSFILRRTQSLLKDYLPVKTECVICCKITDLQERLYTAATNDWWNKKDFTPTSPLSLIVLLKKICNYPHLIKKPDESLDVNGVNVSIAESLHKFLPVLKNVTEEYSGKLVIVKALLKEAIFQKKEKIVIVSCSTRMLDVLAKVCSQNFITFSRLDGSTPISSRQSVVESFNSLGGPPVLLLSSRAGGAGLSLPAASRLVLYDSDWNPAVDHQAMARIWRDGQKRPVFIYRLLTTGTIEEKIYQRQMFKTGLSDAIIDPDNMKSTQKLCDSELKELFVASLDSESTTHDVLTCPCKGDGTDDHKEKGTLQKDSEDVFAHGRAGIPSNQDSSSNSMNQLKCWDHFRPLLSQQLLKEIGLSAANDQISFIFRKIE